MPGSLRLMEVADGRIVRSAKKIGSPFLPFGPNFMLLMMVPQLVPILLSLVLAFVLTLQMRRHRVQHYVFGEERRRFASLWQRALAQLVDVVPFAAGFACADGCRCGGCFSDPESSWSRRVGPPVPFVFFGLFAAAFLWALLVLMAYSYFEGRLRQDARMQVARARVTLGTSFGTLTDEICLRTFVDGLPSVALTRRSTMRIWQRLGDSPQRGVVAREASRRFTARRIWAGTWRDRGFVGRGVCGLAVAPSFFFSTSISRSVSARSKIAPGSPSGISRASSSCNRRSLSCVSFPIVSCNR